MSCGASVVFGQNDPTEMLDPDLNSRQLTQSVHLLVLGDRRLEFSLPLSAGNASSCLGER